MPAKPAINELRQQCLDAIQANKTMLDQLAISPHIDEKLKLEIFGRVLDTSANLAELLAVINEQIRSIDGVRDTETFMHLHTEKNVFAWGQRLPQA